EGLFEKSQGGLAELRDLEPFERTRRGITEQAQQRSRHPLLRDENSQRTSTSLRSPTELQRRGFQRFLGRSADRPDRSFAERGDRTEGMSASRRAKLMVEESGVGRANAAFLQPDPGRIRSRVLHEFHGLPG